MKTMQSGVDTVVSRDGTPISFERQGSGPPLVFVDGALCYRGQGPSGPLATHLREHFTVFTYDRRGRGRSGNANGSAIEREIDDLDALIQAAGGSALVYGVSSGAALALEAAHRGSLISMLALYEAPFIVDGTHPPLPDDFVPRLERAIAEERRSDAVKMFMTLVGMPAIFVSVMRLMPVWSKLTAVAHTLPNDLRLVQDHQRGRPLARGDWSGARMPTLVMDGGRSPAWMRNAMRALADVLPNATYRTLAGQTHMIKPKLHVGPLIEFFTR